MSLPIPEFPALSIRERSQGPYSSRVPRTAGHIRWTDTSTNEPVPDNEVNIGNILGGRYRAYRTRGSLDDITQEPPEDPVYMLSDNFTHPKQLQWYGLRTLQQCLDHDSERRDPITRVQLGPWDTSMLRPVFEQPERLLPPSVIDQESSVGAEGEHSGFVDVLDEVGGGDSNVYDRRVRPRIETIEPAEEEGGEDPRTDDEIRSANIEYERNFQEVLLRADAQREQQRAVVPNNSGSLPRHLPLIRPQEGPRGISRVAESQNLIRASINRYTENEGGRYTYNIEALLDIVNGVRPYHHFLVIQHGDDDLDEEMPRSALEAAFDALNREIFFEDIRTFTIPTLVDGRQGYKRFGIGRMEADGNCFFSVYPLPVRMNLIARQVSMDVEEEETFRTNENLSRAVEAQLDVICTNDPSQTEQRQGWHIYYGNLSFFLRARSVPIVFLKERIHGDNRYVRLHKEILEAAIGSDPSYTVQFLGNSRFELTQNGNLRRFRIMCDRRATLEGDNEWNTYSIVLYGRLLRMGL